MNNVAYHVTPRANLDSICEKGLEPRTGARSLMLGELKDAIYLFPIIEDMENALSNWLGEIFEDEEALVVLEVNISELDIVQSEAGYEILCFETIAVPRIKTLYSM